MTERLNEDAQRILGKDKATNLECGSKGEDSLLNEWAASFLSNAFEYGNMHRVLGIRAQFVDIHRKVGKLQRAWWEGADTTAWREQPREIAMDLIGHLFLAIALIDREESRKTSEYPIAIAGSATKANQTVFCLDGRCHQGQHSFSTGCAYEKGIGVPDA